MLLIKALPEETPTTLAKPSEMTLIHCFTPPALLLDSINPHPHIQKLAMSMSLRSRSYSIMPVTVHRTGLTAEVKASLLNLTDLKSYNSPAA